MNGTNIRTETNMSVGVDSDYEVILNKLITEQRAVLLACLAQFDELADDQSPYYHRTYTQIDD